MGVFALLVGKKEDEAIYPLPGTGSIPMLTGTAMIINDRINYNSYFKPDFFSAFPVFYRP